MKIKNQIITRLIILPFLICIYSTNILAQRSIVQILFDDYIGFNDNVGVIEEEVKFKPYKKLKRRELKLAGFNRKRRKEILEGLKESITRCEYKENEISTCNCKSAGERPYQLKFKYNENKILIETKIFNQKDTTKYVFEYDSLDRPVKTKQVRKNETVITEIADYSKIGEVKLTYYYSNGKIADEQIYPFEIGFKKNVKSISVNRRKKEVVIYGNVFNRENSEYIAEYKLDKRNNWVKRKVFMRTNGRKYKISKSKRALKYEE